MRTLWIEYATEADYIHGQCSHVIVSRAYIGRQTTLEKPFNTPPPEESALTKGSISTTALCINSLHMTASYPCNLCSCTTARLQPSKCLAPDPPTSLFVHRTTKKKNTQLLKTRLQNNVVKQRCFLSQAQERLPRKKAPLERKTPSSRII